MKRGEPHGAVIGSQRDYARSKRTCRAIARPASTAMATRLRSQIFASSALRPVRNCSAAISTPTRPSLASRDSAWRTKPSPALIPSGNRVRRGEPKEPLPPPRVYHRIDATAQPGRSRAGGMMGSSKNACRPGPACRVTSPPKTDAGRSRAALGGRHMRIECALENNLLQVRREHAHDQEQVGVFRARGDPELRPVRAR
jgi:hypothetical protein